MPTILMIVATALWGCTYAFMKVAVDELSPTAFVFLRFFIASIVASPLVFIYRKHLNTRVYLASAILGICIAMTVFLQSMGLQTIPASVSAFLSGCAIVFVVAFKAIHTSTKPSYRDVLIISMCIIGLSLVTGGGGLSMSIGVFYTILGSVLIAVHILVTDKFCKEENGFIIALLQCIFAAIYYILGAEETWEKLPLLSAGAWAAIVFCGVACSVVAFSLQAYSQRFLDPKVVGLIFVLEPVFGAIVSYIFLGEDVMNTKFALGAVLILGSITYLGIEMAQD